MKWQGLLILLIFSFQVFALECYIFDPKHREKSISEQVLDTSAYFTNYLDATYAQLGKPNPQDANMIEGLNKILDNPAATKEFFEIIDNDWPKIEDWHRRNRHLKDLKTMQGDAGGNKVKVLDFIERLKDKKERMGLAEGELTSAEKQIVKEKLAVDKNFDLDHLEKSGLPSDVIEEIPKWYLKIATTKNPAEVGKKYVLHGVNAAVYKIELKHSYRILFVKDDSGRTFILRGPMSHEEYNKFDSKPVLKALGFN